MATINDLPNELLLLIFRLLGETANVQAVSSVCRRWDQLIVPTLRLRIGLYDDGDRGVRGILCRSSRQYEAVALDFPASSCETTDIGDRTGLWILARFVHVTDVELRFYKYDLKRIVRFVDALGPRVLFLTIFANNVQDDTGLELNLTSRKVVPLANMKHLHFVNFNQLPMQFYAWFFRKVPKVVRLKVSICYQGDVIISHYADHLERLEIFHLDYEKSFNHLKCPKLTYLSMRMETGCGSAHPIQLENFFKHAQRLRHFELFTDCPCHDVARAVVDLPNLEVLALRSDHYVPFDDRVKLPALKNLFFGGRIDDVPQLPAVRYLFLYGLTGDRIYSRFVQRAPNLTKLTVDQDVFLDDDAIVCICNGFPQLADLHLKIHSAVELTETAFGAIHLLTQLQRFHISFENISRQVWLGEWIKRLQAPTVIIENLHSQFLPVVMPLAEFELLLANLRTRVLTLRKIFVAVWHRTIRQEVARVRPDLQFFYLEPVDTMLFG
ncbi:hypothetical protein pipiens_007603 [Culex pipiens pipiens]|uniref:F-box domain-containing protein n=1 Tax=Culex pipiens pipiens TaxID=38569 RepID=A0ABD1DMS2_CULPP